MYMPIPARVSGVVAALLLVAGAVLSVPALSAEYYVSTAGNDTSGTGTLQNPYRTVKRAISAGRAGDTITLRAPANNRIYNECDVRLRQKMTLQTYAGEGKARIHCAITTADSVTIQIDPAASGSRLSNLEISGGYYYGIMLQTNWYQGGPATDTGASDVVLEDLLIHSTGRDGIKITPKSNRATIRRVEIHTTGARDNSNADGIDNVNADGMLVEDSYIHDTATTGMYFKGGARDVVVQRNRVENTGDAGILVGFDTSVEFFDLSANPQYYESIRGIVRNNVVRNTGYSGIGMYASKDAIVANNTIINAGLKGHAALFFGLSFQDWDKDAKRPANVNPTVRNNLVMQDGRPCVEIRWVHEEELGGGLSALDGDPGMDWNGYSDRAGACRFIDQRPQSPMLVANGDFDRWRRRMGADAHGMQAAFLLDETGKPQPGSPAIRAGTPLDTVTDDVDGHPRGDPPDLGAYETGLQAAAAPPPPPAVAVGDGTLATLDAGADDADLAARSHYLSLQNAWDRFAPGIPLMKFILLSLTVVALLGLVLAVHLVRKRNVMGWLLAWMKQDWRAPVPKGTTRHLLFCFVDHYEPAWGKPDLEKERARVARWSRDLPKLCAGHRDADGRAPVHSFFYPEEEYREEHLDALVDLCRQGLGEIEIHLHHDNDTEAGLREKLSRFTELLAARHDALPRDPLTGQPRWSFIHGNWALDNSHPSGRHCGVNNELIVLREEGCYADFTLPAAPDPCQTRTVNRIHYAKDDPLRCKSHDTGPRVRVGGRQDADLMIIQGPLGFRWKSRKFGVIPRIENSDIRKVAPPSRDRIDAWVKTGIHVEGRPEWTFVKIHTHGAEDCDMDTLLGPSMDEAHRYLESRYNDGKEWKLHYVSAREMYNLAKAAEAGETGEPGEYRDYVIPRPAYRVAETASEPAMPRTAGSIG